MHSPFSVGNRPNLFDRLGGCKLREFGADFLSPKYKIDIASLDCTRRHRWCNGLVRILDNRDSSTVLDGHETSSAVIEVSAEHDTYYLTAICIASRAKESVNGRPTAVLARSGLQTNFAAVQQHMTLPRRSDEYPGRQNLSIVDSIHHWYLTVPVQDLRKQARAVLGSVQHDEYRRREVPRQSRKNGLQNLEATRGTADHNNVPWRHGPPSEFGCGKRRGQTVKELRGVSLELGEGGLVGRCPEATIRVSAFGT